MTILFSSLLCFLLLLLFCFVGEVSGHQPLGNQVTSLSPSLSPPLAVLWMYKELQNCMFDMCFIQIHTKLGNVTPFCNVVYTHFYFALEQNIAAVKKFSNSLLCCC